MRLYRRCGWAKGPNDANNISSQEETIWNGWLICKEKCGAGESGGGEGSSKDGWKMLAKTLKNS